MQPVEVMQKAMDVAATAERFMVMGDVEGASVLVGMADMYVSMARELRIGNFRMSKTSAATTAAAVYKDTLVRKTVNWDVKEPLPTPEPFVGGGDVEGALIGSGMGVEHDSADEPTPVPAADYIGPDVVLDDELSEGSQS